MNRFSSFATQCWVEAYKETNCALLNSDPEFRHWLEEEYVPIGGGWQY